MKERRFYEGDTEESALAEIAALPSDFIAALAGFVSQPHPSFPHIQCSRRVLGATVPNDNNGKPFAGDIYDLESDCGLAAECYIDVQLLKVNYDYGGIDQLRRVVWAELTAFSEGIDEEEQRLKCAPH